MLEERNGIYPTSSVWPKRQKGRWGRGRSAGPLGRCDHTGQKGRLCHCSQKAKHLPPASFKKILNLECSFKHMESQAAAASFCARAAGIAELLPHLALGEEGSTRVENVLPLRVFHYKFHVTHHIEPRMAPKCQIPCPHLRVSAPRSKGPHARITARNKKIWETFPQE